jgi:energy-coupling factor transport system ATP-binding protein
MDEAVSVHDVSFSYRSWTTTPAQPVLSHLSLSVKRGEKVLVLAPFDAGKSTFARILAGLCPKYLSGTLTGTLSLDGCDLSHTEPWDLVEHVGYVSQNPQEQYIAQTVEDELAFPLESLGVGKQEMHQRVAEALAQWRLSSYATVSEARLSGGERKRVLLALTTMLDPAVWVLDESFDDLDVQWRDYLAQRIRKTGRTVVVLSSRYLSQFDGVFNRFFVVEQGALAEGSREESRTWFSRLCGDDRLCRLDPLPVTGNVHRLEATDVRFSRTREGQEFSLTVPSFSLASGEIVTLTGPNGSGKSTFARLCCGLDSATSGVFRFDGDTVDTSERNRLVGYLFQNPDLQIFLPTVRDELSWSLLRDRRIPKDTVEEKVGSAAELFGLSLDDTPSTMSYPRRKRLQAAVYYLLDRPLCILDELDNALTYQMAQEIVRLLSQNGCGMVVITHDDAFARLVADRGYVVRGGRMEKA